MGAQRLRHRFRCSPCSIRTLGRSCRTEALVLSGLALFTGASALCAAAGSVWILVGSRILQAAGAALLSPAAMGLFLSEFPPEKRSIAVALFAAVGATAGRRRCAGRWTSHASKLALGFLGQFAGRHRCLGRWNTSIAGNSRIFERATPGYFRRPTLRQRNRIPHHGNRQRQRLELE